MQQSSIADSNHIERLLLPFQEFFDTAASGGIVLMVCAVLALSWANSPWYESYHHLWETPVSISIGHAVMNHSLHWWINDGLMAVFFFVVGLEIKRELLVGELSSVRQALLPLLAAMGGMIVPALCYVAVNAGDSGIRGWGAPMATDIAFALGVLALLGDRIPPRLKILLAAVAIVDDIGAVLVIALFYTSHIGVTYLLLAGGLLLIVLGGNIMGIRNPLFYACLGILVWLAFLRSGVHSTVAGVLLAMLIPARTKYDADKFEKLAGSQLEEFRKARRSGEGILTNHAKHAALLSLQSTTAYAETPLQRLEHALVPWVDYAIMPLFALANAGVRIDGSIATALADPVSVGILIGLFVGKQAGILGAVTLLVKSGITRLPPGLCLRHVHGVSLLAGIGFTMSLFIGALAFDDPAQLASAKLAVIVASFVSGVAGWLVLRGMPQITCGER